MIMTLAFICVCVSAFLLLAKLQSVLGDRDFYQDLQRDTLDQSVAMQREARKENKELEAKVAALKIAINNLDKQLNEEGQKLYDQEIKVAQHLARLKQINQISEDEDEFD